MTDLGSLMQEVFEICGAYSEDGQQGWIGMLRANRMMVSLDGLVKKHGGDVLDEEEIEDWIRADVESIVGLSPSQREDMIRLGVMMAIYEQEDEDGTQ